MLQTLHSDTKINILNPNLDVNMFIKGVIKHIWKVFVPNKMKPVASLPGFNCRIQSDHIFCVVNSGAH